MTQRLTKAIQYLRPASQFSVSGDGSVTWHDQDQTEPTQAEIDAAIVAAPWEFAERMAASDAILSRTEEDLADALVANGGTIPDALATKVADKKALRSAG
jgi:hypothetical protein